MSRPKPKRDRALFYLRDSLGRADQTPGKYVEWAAKDAQLLDLRFDGTEEIILEMIRSGNFTAGDIYLDYDVQGHVFDRPTLNALRQRIANDPTVGHLYIPMRERLARPNSPEDALQLETGFRRTGITIHYKDVVLKAFAISERADIAETLTGLIGFHQSGKYRSDLAIKIIEAQRSLSEQGLSPGRRPPIFLRRWLLDQHGNQVRELNDGEYVRMAGHHVAWLPTDEKALALALRIIDMLETLPASKVAKQLTLEGIPSPDTGRTRKDRGVRHAVSGVWHATTVTNTARSMALLGLMTYGKRSMGDQKRFSSEGPRELAEDDLRPDGKPKVIQNPRSEWISAPAKHEPLVDPERMTKLLTKLDARGKSQRGKPRSPDQANNPIGTRIFDMACGWPMYREPHVKKAGKTFRYKCGAYTQSHGATCTHNHIDGPLVTRLMLGAIRQRLLQPEFQSRVAKELERLAKADTSNGGSEAEIVRAQNELVHVDAEMTAVKRNLARARTDEQYDAVSTEFERLNSQQKTLQAQLDQLRGKQEAPGDREIELAAAIGLMKRLSEFAVSNSDYLAARELLELVNAKLYLSFSAKQWGKRTVYQPTGGVITFGTTEPPIKIYEGRTGRVAVKSNLAQEIATSQRESNGDDTDEKENSLGNVSRGDCPTVEPLNAFVNAYVAAMLGLPPAHVDSLTELVAMNGASSAHCANRAAG